MTVKACMLAVFVVLMLSPVYEAQCDQVNFARANPGLCYDGPLGGFPGGHGGGGGGGGLLGAIGRVLGGLTGGIL